jgi:hypothetical protein
MITTTAGQYIQIVLINIAGDVITGEAGAIERFKRWIACTNRIDQIIKILINQIIRAYCGTNLFDVTVMSNKLIRGRHIDSIYIWIPDRWGSRSQIYLVCTSFARHSDDLA